MARPQILRTTPFVLELHHELAEATGSTAIGIDTKRS